MNPLANQACLRVGIFGGSGYGGAELLRILLFHPGIEINLVTANEHAGKAVADVHRNLFGLTDLRFDSMPEGIETLDYLDIIFLALPHGEAMKIAPRLPAHVKVIDLSGDFRINDAAEFARYYEREHTAMDAQKGFVYGLTELNRERISTAQRIGNPGCFATAVTLALAPLVAGNRITGRVVVDAKTGSSGSGAKPAANTHHPQRANSFYAYKPFQHQHTPEIEQALRAIGDWASEFVFITHSLPVPRGIFASVYVEMKDEMSAEELTAMYGEFYRASFFVRIVPGSPDIGVVKMTNFCDIGIAARGRQAVVFAALDNLVKGAAGQAVQNMNVMCGFDERAGLMFAGTNP